MPKHKTPVEKRKTKHKTLQGQLREAVLQEMRQTCKECGHSTVGTIHAMADQLGINTPSLWKWLKKGSSLPGTSLDRVYHYIVNRGRKLV